MGVINKLAPRFDRILLDTGAGISDVVLYAVSLADDVALVVTPEPSSMTDAYATVKVLASQQQRDGSWLGSIGFKLNQDYTVQESDVPHVGVTALAAADAADRERAIGSRY